MQQQQIYERARLARDARFDGQFYIGVITTGIYCRPICPANSPKAENIKFYPSAAAAADAGFRPCLRCRPECAPGSPAWSGTSTTVRRGLRLIANGALDSDGIENLAERLGVTSRHLRRLFTRHIGASPLAVAHTQRLHFAKRLIDETTLPLNNIAIAAGFNSTRRFNDTFKKTYGRSPGQLRKLGRRQNNPDPEAALSVRLPYRQPFAWNELLAFFRHRATPGVEVVDGDCYRRTLLVDNRQAVVELRPSAKGNYLALTLHRVPTPSLFETVQKARDVFDLDAPVAEIATVLSSDPLLEKMLQAHPGIRVPGAWDGFELTIRAILGQQISVKAATTLAGRIAARYGEPLDHASPDKNGLLYLFPGAERLSRAKFDKIGLVQSRANTIQSVAKAVVSGDLQFDTANDPEKFCTVLKSIKGIGDWTAQYVAMRALKNPDAFPASDLGLLKSLHYPERISPAELSRHAERWRPWRAYAALLLWNSLSGSGG